MILVSHHLPTLHTHTHTHTHTRVGVCVYVASAVDNRHSMCLCGEQSTLESTLCRLCTPLNQQCTVRQSVTAVCTYVHMYVGTFLH